MVIRLLALAVVASLTLNGCGSTRCGDQEVSDDPNAPELVDFFILPQDKQMPGDPWTVLFGIGAKDADGNLGDGAAEFFLNSETEATQQDLDTVFRQSGAELNATAADLYITLRFAEQTVNDGAQVRLGLQLVDARELRSNCFTLELEFDVLPAPQAMLAPMSSVAVACAPRQSAHRGGLF